MIRDINQSYAITKDLEALSRKDTDLIIKDSKSFWAIFCKAYSDLPNTDKGDSARFTATILDNKLTIKGNKSSIEAIKKVIEFIRKSFERDYKDKQESTFILIPDYGNYFYRRPSRDPIHLDDQYKHYYPDSITKQLFDQSISPCMKDFSRSLGAICTRKVTIQLIDRMNNWDSFGAKERVHAFKFDWSQGLNLVFPITPLLINKENPLYSLYQKQKKCDLTLSAKGGETVKVHSLVLYASAGKVMRALLDAQMKESIEKVFELKEFTLSTVKAFAEFCYLGTEGISQKSIWNNEIDLIELFKMAHLFQYKDLIDHCTNMIALFSSRLELEDIKYLSEKYDNEHLKQLHDHLAKKNEEKKDE